MKRLSIICYLLSVISLSAAAQDENRLYLGDISGSMGETVYVPVYFDNTSTYITAVQFDVELPSGFSLIRSNMVTTLNTERTDGHTLIATASGQKGRVIISSSDNKPLKGTEGELLQFAVKIETTLTEGAVYDIKVTKAMSVNTQGDNVLTGFEGCSVTLEGNPDFEVSNVCLIGVDSIAPRDTLTVSYTVRNVGTKASKSGFTTSLGLFNSNGLVSSYLSSISHSELLEPNEEITFTEQYRVYNNFSSSTERVWPGVSLNANNGSGELSSATDNNMSQNTNDIHIVKTVYEMSPTDATWQESSGGNKYLYLYRYGYVNASYEYFNVKIEKGDERVKLNTSSVYFRYTTSTSLYSNPYLTITNDDEQNEDDEIIVSFTKQSDTNIVLYGHYTLVDDDLTGFRLTTSSTEVTEGETFQLTATLPAVASTDVEATVSISGYANYFSFPSTITIPAGSQSVTFDVTALDDETVTSTFTTTFSVVSTDYTKGSRTISRIDNDNNLFSNIVDEEWELIKAIYQKANGANWTNNRWTLGETKEQTGSLSGVTIINGHVRQISLSYSGMNCELPAEFLMFPRLTSVYLVSNRLTGRVEDVIGSLSEPLAELTTLNLSGNQLTGNLGACNFAELMPAMITLNVENNKIRDITPPLPSRIKTLAYGGQTLDENVGIYSEFYTMTADERFALLPTVLTYNHQYKSYPQNDNYMLSGDDWNLFTITLNNSTVSIGATNYVGSQPLNRQPSGQVTTLQNKRTTNSVKLTFDFEMGDANYDTAINLSDMQLTINCAIDPVNNTYTLFNFYAANMIQDDVVNVQDVVVLINSLLDNGLTPSLARRLTPSLTKGEGAEQPEANSLCVADGKLVLRSEVPVAALDIVLDGGEAQWTEALSWFSQKQRGGRTIFYSFFGDEIPAGETVLAQFSGEIVDAMIVSLDGSEIPLQIGSGDVDGIRQIENGELIIDNSPIYDVSGRKLSTLQSPLSTLPKGLYIVNGKKHVIK